MEVILKSSSGYQIVPLQAALLAKRIVFITGKINTESVQKTLQQLLYLEEEDRYTQIRIVLNSPGGEVAAGVMLYHQIKEMSNSMDIHIYATEVCASIAAIVLCGGKPGKRHIVKGTQLLIHEPLISSSTGGVSGSASEIRKTAEKIMETKRCLNEILAENTGHSITEIEEIISHGDYYMTAEEAVNFCLADDVVERI